MGVNTAWVTCLFYRQFSAGVSKLQLIQSRTSNEAIGVATVGRAWVTMGSKPGVNQDREAASCGAQLGVGDCACVRVWGRRGRCEGVGEMGEV